MYRISFLLLILVLLSPLSTGQDSPDTRPSVNDVLSRISPTGTAPTIRGNERLASSSIKTVTLAEQTYAYKLFVNKTRISDNSNTFPPADIISYSYEAQTNETRTERPVIFAFNGGPGSASMWLHMGAWGPKRIDAPGAPDAYRPPPYSLVDNRAFLIDVADIVFIDPVGTGLSRPVEGDASAFFDTRVDARSMCSFIRNWMKAEDRWEAPIYIAGESYGAIRAAGIATHQACRDVTANIDGLIMISGLLDFPNHSTRRPGAQIAKVPTRAALAWYHGMINKADWGGDFATFLNAAREIAVTRLGPAALKGTALSGQERLAVRRDVGRLIGVDPESVSASPDRSLTELFRNAIAEQKGGQPHLQDGRYIAKDRSGGSTLPPLNDGQLSKLFRGHLTDHIKAMSGLEMTNAYQSTLGNGQRANWDFSFLKAREYGRGTNMAEQLARQRRIRLRNRPLRLDEPATSNRRRYGPPEYRILVASGLHDGNTPFYAMELALQQAGFSPDRYDVKLYEGGHMMWLDQTTGEQLADDIRSFINEREAARQESLTQGLAPTP